MARSRPARKRVAVVTGTRAEFGLLESVLRAMQGHRRLESQLIVTGMHLLPRFGRTIDQIRRAGWRIDATVHMQRGSGDSDDEAEAVGRGTAGIARALARLRTDIVVVLGDRIEAFAGACAASAGRRVLAHLHGGDRALGDIDDALRNAITRLAHVHLVASRDAARRLRRMGEEPGRIYHVGAPGIDEIRNARMADRAEPRRSDRAIRALIGPLADRPYAVLVQHPRARSPREEARTMRDLVSAVEQCALAGVAIYPNTDPGCQGIVQVLQSLVGRKGWCVFKSLVREDYLRLAMRSAVLVGNSSSGIVESASLGVNAVNVGPRQLGRLRSSPGVLDATETTDDMIRAIRQALRRRRPISARSVYGDGQASRRIVEVLDSLIISPELLQKGLMY